MQRNLVPIGSSPEDDEIKDCALAYMAGKQVANRGKEKNTLTVARSKSYRIGYDTGFDDFIRNKKNLGLDQAEAAVNARDCAAGYFAGINCVRKDPLGNLIYNDPKSREELVRSGKSPKYIAAYYVGFKNSCAKLKIEPKKRAHPEDWDLENVAKTTGIRIPMAKKQRIEIEEIAPAAKKINIVHSNNSLFAPVSPQYPTTSKKTTFAVSETSAFKPFIKL